MAPMKLVALITVVITGGLLLYASSDFPEWGDPQSPANASDLSRHYITETRVETEVPNMVTAVLADYRSYDTMFETVVIFVAGLGILSVLKRPEEEDAHPLAPVTERYEERDMITMITCRITVPLIQIFALYVIAHGHYSPGGGFGSRRVYLCRDGAAKYDVRWEFPGLRYFEQGVTRGQRHPGALS